MELPILSQSYQPTSAAMVRAVGRARALLARTVAQEASLPGATAFSNPHRPDVRSANYAGDLRLPEGLDARTVLDQIMTHYDRLGLRPQALEAAQITWPQTLADEIERCGYKPAVVRVYLLEHHIPSTQRDLTTLQIIPARAAFSQLHTYCISEVGQAPGLREQQVADEAQTIIDHLDEPKLDLYIGRIDGQIRGMAGVVSLGEMGVIYDGEFDAAHRDRNVAATMTEHVLDVCARAGMKQVILERSDKCASIPFYESMGFVEVASTIRYQQP